MDQQTKDELRAVEKILVRDGCKVLPAGQVPTNADFHVCTTHPVVGVVEHQAVCSKCGRPVFYSSPVPQQIPKICVSCYLAVAKDKPASHVVTEDTLRTVAKLRHLGN
jgi:hypothetical protein